MEKNGHISVDVQPNPTRFGPQVPHDPFYHPYTSDDLTEAARVPGGCWSSCTTLYGAGTLFLAGLSRCKSLCATMGLYIFLIPALCKKSGVNWISIVAGMHESVM